MHRSSMKTSSFVGAALSAALFLLHPAEAAAQELPVLRADFDFGAMGLFDRGALNQQLRLGGFEALPAAGFRYGGAFAFEFRRFHFGFGVHGLDVGVSDVRKMRSTYVTLNLGYRLFGSHASWEFIPVVGVGGGVSNLTLGPATQAASFQEALRARGPQDLNAASFIVHVGSSTTSSACITPRSRRGSRSASREACRRRRSRAPGRPATPPERPPPHQGSPGARTCRGRAPT
jgi:hypothetical protein